MKGLKKFLFVFQAALCALCCSFAFSSCKGDGTRGLKYESITFSKARVVGMGKCRLSDIAISSKYNGRPVVEIKNRAFENCNSLTSVIIPDSVTSIGGAAFYKCSSLADVVISDSVTSIGGSAFGSCESLQSIKIPDGVTLFKPYVFSRCVSLKSITVPNGVKRIGRGAFLDCFSLQNITIPDKLISIEEAAFQNTAYYYVGGNWEDGLLYIGSHLIEAKKEDVIEATVKEGIKTIADAAFSGCELLENVTVLEGVIMVGENAFQDCAALTSVTLPKSVRVIGARAFRNCEALKTINYQGTKRNWYEVSKNEGWDTYTGEYTVVCTDGRI